MLKWEKMNHSSCDKRKSILGPTNITLLVRKTLKFLQESGSGQECLPSLLLFNICWRYQQVYYTRKKLQI